MACFIAPTMSAIVTTTIRKKIPAKYHLDWLNCMLWGGVIVLVIDHITNGEIIFSPPFFTSSLSDMFVEIVKVGIPMTLAIFCVWGIMVLLSFKIINFRNKKIIIK